MSDMNDGAPAPKSTDRFAAARAAKAAKAAQKQAVGEAKASGLKVDAETGEIAPKASSGRFGKISTKPPQKWNAIKPRAHRALPPPGDHDARIADVALHDKGDVLWMSIRYELLAPHEGERPEPEFGAIAAMPGSPHELRTADGLRLLNRAAAAAGVTLPDDLDPFDLPKLLEGKACRVRLAHKTIDGVPALIVRRAIAKAS